jgi:two-component system sensor histidine kinase/response regulator
MYKLLLTICLLALQEISAAQNNVQLDSLLKAVDAEKADSNKMRLYRQIGNFYSNNNAGKAIEYYVKSLDLAKKLDNKLFIANSYYSIGFCYLNKADFEKSLDNYLQSIRLYEELKDSFRLSNALMSVGNVYGQNKDFKKTDEYYGWARRVIEAMNDSLQLGGIYGSMGTNFDQQKQYDSALKYLGLSNKIGLLVKDDYTTAYALSNLGLTYKHLNRTADALLYFDSVLITFERMGAPVDNMASAYNNIGATYAQAKDYVKAKIAFNKSLALADSSGSTSIAMENYRNMSDMYADMKNYEQEVFYLKKYYDLKDSLFTIDSKNQLTQLEADYQVGKKDIEIVKKDAEVAKQRNERNLFIIIALAAALVLATVAFLYGRIKKANRLLQEKNVQILHQKDELQTLNHVKDRLFSIISHDLRNPLVTLRSYLSLVEDSTIPAEKRVIFKNHTMNAVIHTSDMLDNLLTWANMQIKNTEAASIPLNIPDCVMDVVNNVQAQANQKQVNIQQDIQATAALGDYNIVSIALRNLLTNAIKYSEPGKSILVNSAKEGGQVLVSVKDEGVGMTKDQIQQILADQNNSSLGTGGEKGTGLGLFLVKELLTKINADLQIESEQGRGSTFTIRLQAF